MSIILAYIISWLQDPFPILEEGIAVSIWHFESEHPFSISGMEISVSISHVHFYFIYYNLVILQNRTVHFSFKAWSHREAIAKLWDSVC